MMKKTLIALALATTAVSGSAMAWTANGTGGSLELGGTLTPAITGNPWEVLVGSAVSNLDAKLKTGDTEVNIPVTTSITALGIRTVTNQPFKGAVGIDPHINFNGAVDLAAFSGGVSTLTLDVKNDADTKIGVLTAPFGAAATESSVLFGKQFSLYSPNVANVFFGGLAQNPGGAFSNAKTVKAFLNKLNPDILANYNDQGTTEDGEGVASFSLTGDSYSGVYGAGIESGQNMKLTLKTPAASDAIVWKASLPITVSYQ